ncbi:helix-turn-helix transcriptional regulator [Sedimenticola selenatireducens]|uniref:WYL domain-containing protein n=1 Tax=Sedimenticola selenatireducens TaxID=191960 RepID=A0A558DU21_9GAMM|nr:WYL domain-containing protein [Sedimenticola selenatireducens]TVO77037.1 WYL domain-containing protein [Sedimenticola selenatireducens]TVT64479.1 MAG: WYL domain-containing protein [Sedimenticola selenatireducens]
MDRFDRIFDLHKLLSASRYPVSRQRIEEELECSRATAKRIIDAMRLYLNAPIKYDRELNGYYYDRSEGEMYELPGVWFNSSELHALLSVQQLLEHVQPGLLDQQLAPLKNRIESLLKAQALGGNHLSQRIRILRATSRPAGEYFQRVSGALAQRRQLKISYYQRASDAATERTLSPQRLTYYRDNWYLDAYCHLRQGLRTFALDALTKAEVLTDNALDLTPEELDAHTTNSYGIFSGQSSHMAHLRFTPRRARWVSREAWHPLQQSSWSEKGEYELRIPYHREEELVMDILKYGADVEVIGPSQLRSRIQQQLQNTLALYKEK